MQIGRKLIFWLVCQPVPDPEQRRDVNINLALGRKYQPGFFGRKYQPGFLVRKYQPGFLVRKYQPGFLDRKYQQG